ncbi:HNH endonuclease signature motif containing protein [Corynebacterium fournieri]|uniref:HNH endonuclease signature motif containing protein n=1 Tax=Corynebacterium fournieri TaxID=1852390 RepID=UPI001E5F9314|nr:HNH endonuclease signature motif containing protein [Corynebacterium fournieri]
MIEDYRLDIRTVTMGISLIGCTRSTMEATAQAVYDRVVERARDLVSVCEGIERELGIPIVNKRISVTPVALVAAGAEGNPVEIARALDRAAGELGVNFVGGYREQAAREAARAAAREEARRKQEEARRAAERVNAEKQRVIRQELDKLVGDAKGARARLQADALAEAPRRSVKDLRATVRRWVERENRKHVEPSNPNAGMENRGLHIGAQRADGTCRITIDAVASDSALFKALSDKGLVPNSNLPEGVEDYRTPSQRRYDQFSEILKHYDTCEKPTGGGCASVVVSVTLDELTEADPTTKFATNTGIELDAFDLQRLGMDGTSDFVLTVDDATSLPLNLYRTRRLASLAQRITLLAVQGVCAWTGCTAPLTETEIHHITSWLQGGDTNIENLTALCRTHHRCNNDFKDHRNNTSHMDVDPTTGRAGVKEPGCATLQFNHADAAEHSAVNRLRKRHRQRERTTVPDPGCGTAPPETRVPPEPPDPPPPREPVEPPSWAKGQDPYPPF